MLGYSVVNTKGQVTLPAQIRKEAGIKPQDKIMVLKEDDKILIVPLADFHYLRGSVPMREVPADFKKLRQEFIEYLGTRKH